MTINTPQYREALDVLSRNNGNNSSKFNGLLAVLEGAEGDITLREKISKHLENILNPPKNKKQLKALSSIREKVAYVASNTLPRGGDIVEKCSEVIDIIEDEILKKQDLSESNIIRNSALNRFEVKISLEQQAKLNRIENDLKEIVTEKVPDLLPNLNSKNETIAQRIQKIREILSYLLKNNLTDKYPEGFGEFEKLLDPLYELDKKYHTLNYARNTFYDIQRGYGEVVVLNSNEKNTLNEALISLCGSHLEDYFTKNIQTNMLNISLPSLLQEIKSNNIDIDNKLKQFNLKVYDFDRFFMFYFSTEILKKSKIDLDKTKKEVFKDKLRDFESDVKNWREIQRNRLIKLCINTNDNISEIENIFDRDRKLFLRNGNTEDDKNLKDGLLVVLNRRYTGITQDIRNQLADAIMNENVATNELYYGYNNPLFNDKDDSNLQAFFKSTGNAGRNIEKISQYTTPILGGFVNFTRKAVELSGGAVSSVITGTTGGVRKVVGNYNTWAGAKSNSFLGSVVKFPFKLSQIITRPVGWGVSGVDILANTGVKVVSGSYNGINSALNTATKGEINDLFDIFTKTYKHSVNLLGSGVAYSGDKTFDILKTNQKREILISFYSSRDVTQVKSLLESIDIQSKLQDSSPYIFDDISDNLGYDIKETNVGVSENIKLFSEKLKQLLKGLNKDKNKDQEIYDMIIDSFELMKYDIDSSEAEEEKFISIVAKINNLFLKLRDKARSIKDERDRKQAERQIKENQINAAFAIRTNTNITSLENKSSELGKEIDILNEKLGVLSDLGIGKSGSLIKNKFIFNLNELAKNINSTGKPLSDYTKVLNAISL